MACDNSNALVWKVIFDGLGNTVKIRSFQVLKQAEGDRGDWLRHSWALVLWVKITGVFMQEGTSKSPSPLTLTAGQKASSLLIQFKIHYDPNDAVLVFLMMLNVTIQHKCSVLVRFEAKFIQSMSDRDAVTSRALVNASNKCLSERAKNRKLISMDWNRSVT